MLARIAVTPFGKICKKANIVLRVKKSKEEEIQFGVTKDEREDLFEWGTIDELPEIIFHRIFSSLANWSKFV